MSVVHTRPLQLNLPLPLFLVVLHFVDDTPWSDVAQLGGVSLVDIFIIETLHVVLIGLLLVRVVGSPHSRSAPETGLFITVNHSHSVSSPEDWVDKDQVDEVDEEEREDPDDEAHHHLDGDD